MPYLDQPIQAPYPLALIICDAVHVDPATGKKTLLGTFSSIGAKTFPASHPLMAIYFALTDGRGKTRFKLRLIDAEEENEPIVELENEFEFGDPRQILEGVFHVAGVQFPAPGEYRFQLFGAGEFLIERRIVVHQIGGQP